MPLDQLIYSSAAVHGFTEMDLSLLLLKARTNNASLSLTGMLLYRDGSFLQVLEGEHTRVQALFDHISKDPRHTRVTILARRTLDRREFGQWAMGFSSMRGLADDFPGYSDFLRHRHEPDKAGGLAAQLLARFRDEKFEKYVDR
jgi:hypothetical protein